MAKHLTPKDVVVIIGLIDGWEGKLQWEALCDCVEPLIGTRPTRQTLSAHERIKSAYDQKKARHKSGFLPSKRPASLDLAAQRIRSLENENARLKDENSRLIEHFVRWQYNAYKHGVSQEKLDAPMPVVDRESSEERR